jgi:outer membrane protein OmpA-like peptidoglycan-associated protein
VGAVYFAAAGSRVSAAALPTVAAAVARAGRADRFVLTSYTDPYGPPEFNRQLADRRAESVATALTARGVEPAQLIVRSRPQCCATQPLSEREAAPYRRVDIEILTHRAVLSEERGHGPQPHS